MSVFALGLLVLVAVLLPVRRGAYEGAETGTRPDARRYRLLLATTALAVTGAYTAFTYVEPFLLQVSGLDRGEVSPVLFVRGLAGSRASPWPACSSTGTPWPRASSRSPSRPRPCSPSTWVDPGRSSRSPRSRSRPPPWPPSLRPSEPGCCRSLPLHGPRRRRGSSTAFNVGIAWARCWAADC